MPTLFTIDGVTQYACDICGHLHDGMSLAVLCEARGKPQEYQCGLMFGDHSPESGRPDLTFAVAENHVLGHINYLMCWLSWGDLRAEWDDLPPNRGSTVWVGPLGDADGKLDLGHPGTQRMLKALKETGVEATFWRDKP